MPVPQNLNYDMWLGSTPQVPYTEKRVHPQVGYDRPGWLRCEQFGAGMITGWGAHHIDTAHWGMDTEYTGPVEIWGTAEFPKKRPLGRARPVQDRGAVRRRRPHDRQRRLPERHQVHRHRGLDLRLARQRDGDGERSRGEAAGQPGARRERPEDPQVGHRPDEIHLYESKDHHGNWLDASGRGSSRSRRSRSRTAPARRACSTTSR